MENEEEEIIDRNLWVYDIETIRGCFTYTAVNTITDETVQYVIHKDRDDRDALRTHLNSVKGLIGFNSIGFDYPVIHEFLTTTYISAVDAVYHLYEKAQAIIGHQSKEGFNPHLIWEKEWLIPQLDLFKLWHFNNKARSTSLKALEIAMGFPNVMEMEISHTKSNITAEDIIHILEYNLNDVFATLEFYRRSEEKIQLRKDLNAKYNLKCLNFSDSKIGESLMLKLYCKKTGKNPWNVKKLRTYRKSIDLGKCIFDYIEFKSEEFNKLLTLFKSKVIRETKGSITESVVYKGFKYDYGTGGIHGCIKSGIYDADDDYIIIDSDVASLYPSIGIVNRLFPQHLGIDFTTVYENDIVKPRLKAKAEGNKVMADGLKLSANSCYGKSNDLFSFLYDPLYTIKITLNGQLMLSMLAEDIVSQIGNLTMLQINTDGLTVKLLKTDKQKYLDICAKWEVKTKLVLEHIQYSRMVIRDVNNYCAITTDKKIKYKGAFEIDKEYHKNHSFKIIPIALNNYYFKNISIKETVENHKEIYNFCGTQKFRGEDVGEIHTIKDSKLQVQTQQKNTRYYISTNGDSFMKHYAKGSYQKIHWGYNTTIFNKYIKKEIKDYKINYDFYIKEVQKELQQIENKQLQMF